MGQTWAGLLFAHWAVPEEQLRALIPTGLTLDTFEGNAYLGVTPFAIRGLRIRGALPLPVVSSFLELNVRTYVTSSGRPGIWFFSLDASRQLAVAAARWAYKLPYFRAAIESRPHDDWISYECVRRDDTARPFVFDGRYRPAGPVRPAKPGSIEHFLAERYCLYTVDGEGVLWRAEIHHGPWPLQAAEAEIALNTMFPDGVDFPDSEPLVHFSDRQDVLIWRLSRVTP
jgi:uncharacterized protein